jgi:hypothetical protein
MSGKFVATGKFGTHTVVWSPAKLYAKTGNPLFVWCEIDRCRSADPPRRLPAWVLRYLAGASREIVDVDIAILEPRARQRRVLGALGFGGQGGTNPWDEMIKTRHSINVAHTDLAKVRWQKNPSARRRVNRAREDWDLPDH